MPDRLRLYHVSEENGIKTFRPRPTPVPLDSIEGDVVFAISKKLLHNYLFPRECPRVTYYQKPSSTESDKLEFFGNSAASYIIAIEEKWLPLIQQATIFVYEFPIETFLLSDPVAEYYVSYREVSPLSVMKIENPLNELLNRTEVELRILPEIVDLAFEISKSSLNYSLIRMRNANRTNSL